MVEGLALMRPPGSNLERSLVETSEALKRFGKSLDRAERAKAAKVPSSSEVPRLARTELMKRSRTKRLLKSIDRRKKRGPRIT
jgi:hypothetical protein